MHRSHSKISSYQGREDDKPLDLSRIPDTCLSLCRADMGILDLCSKFQAGEGLAEVILLRTDHDEHECFGIAA